MSDLPVYDWQYPASLQDWDWDCAQESIRWCLLAYGRTPDNGWMEASMQAAGVVTPAVGCTDASGAGLARWVRDEYAEYGYDSTNQDPVTFDRVKDEALQHIHPLAIGGRQFYHWVGVRGYDALTDKLQLANPAPGYKGVYQTMSRAQFEGLGSFSLVRVVHPEAEGQGGAPITYPLGPDVASHQGAVDWGAVRGAGCLYGFTKLTGGAWYVNSTGPANWSGMQAAQMLRGGYHFCFETSGQPLPGPGPEAEAQWFLDHLLPLGSARGDMVVCDIEQGAGPLGHWLLRWLQHVEAAVGYPPLVYTGAWFADPHGFADVPELARYPLWLADYSAATMPPPCAPWDRVSFWQYTDRASVPGIVGPVDGNRFNGSADQLWAYGKPGLLPPADPYAPWSGLIGSGLLEMMREDGVLPAQSRSTWLPLGQSPADVEQCLAVDGTNYCWTVSSSNRGFRYRPS